jgi:hypothetical protein
LGRRITFIPDSGFLILMTVELALSVWAMWCWGRAWADQSPERLKWAAGASACWFAMAAVSIAFIFDFGLH